MEGIGLGTWRMGENARTRRAEVSALRLAFDLGYRVIDSAEMYGDGGAEEVVGGALAEALRAGGLRREDVTIVSKVLPSNASRRGLPAACERSRRRLGVDRIDLYLLHWPGVHPLAETIAGFEALQAQGAITRWGVSNFDLAAMRRLAALPGGAACGANQVQYSLAQRGIDFDLRPWQRERGVPLMAYCPLDQGTLARAAPLAAIAAPLGLSAAQLALAWTLREGGVTAIPKAGRESHLRENLAAAPVVLDAATLAALDLLYPPPRRAEPLAVT
ncbi:MAG TPA: aldo/keto reductase [Burkholderiaceae bacterium]|nr:aldo/keto reductase [Burkholderiaceae bacterium]